MYINAQSAGLRDFGKQQGALRQGTNNYPFCFCVCLEPILGWATLFGSEAGGERTVTTVRE